MFAFGLSLLILKLTNYYVLSNSLFNVFLMFAFGTVKKSFGLGHNGLLTHYKMILN